jgi:hypothetical protein
MVWITCRRDWQGDKIMIARKTGKVPTRTSAEGGQVELVLACF